jgi:hypothetical protein
VRVLPPHHFKNQKEKGDSLDAMPTIFMSGILHTTSPENLKVANSRPTCAGGAQVHHEKGQRKSSLARARKNCFNAELHEADLPVSKSCSSFEKQI